MRTSLMGARILFDVMPRKDTSQKYAIIRALYLYDGRPLVLAQMEESKRLIEMPTTSFTIIEEGRADG